MYPIFRRKRQIKSTLFSAEKLFIFIYIFQLIFISFSAWFWNWAKTYPIISSIFQLKMHDFSAENGLIFSLKIELKMTHFWVKNKAENEPILALKKETKNDPFFSCKIELIMTWFQAEKWAEIGWILSWKIELKMSEKVEDYLLKISSKH